MTIVLDTNIWVSLALNKQLDLVAELYDKGIVIAGCDELLGELITVLFRPKFSKYFSKSYLENFIIFYHSVTTFYKLEMIDKVVTDEKDNYLFALCKTSEAEYFITGDKLLLDVIKYEKTTITTLAGLKNTFV